MGLQTRFGPLDCEWDPGCKLELDLEVSWAPHFQRANRRDEMAEGLLVNHCDFSLPRRRGVRPIARAAASLYCMGSLPMAC